MSETEDVISEFVEHYVQKFDFYEQLASLVAGQLRSELTRRGIRAIVSSRAKDPEKLRQKLIKRSTRKENPKQYKALKDIDADIVDLAGVRIALYFPGDQKKIGQVIDEVLERNDPIKTFPDETSTPLSKGLVGYIAEHYRARLREDRIPMAQRRYSQGRVEVQVASVLMHAWAEIDHDLRYKPIQGSPSEDELATLDEVNGLVLTGEIALERLQRLIEERVGRPDSKFQNIYELQEYLSAHQPNAAASEIGRVNFLLRLLEHVGIDTPARLQPYLDRAAEEQSGRPFADRLIDTIIAEDPERLSLFSTLLKEERAIPSAAEGAEEGSAIALGRFLNLWTALERRLQRLTGRKMPDYSAKLLQLSLTRYGVAPEVQDEIYSLREIRNRLVHGQNVLTVSEIDRAANRLAVVLQRLENLQEPPVPLEEA